MTGDLRNSVAWLDTKLALSADRVDGDLRAVLERRFHGALHLVQVERGKWRVLFPERPIFDVTILLRERQHRLVFQSTGAWPSWCQHVLCSELGVLYQGEYTDVLSARTWTPDPLHWPRYESFVRTTYRREIEREGDRVVVSKLAEVPLALHG